MPKLNKKIIDSTLPDPAADVWLWDTELQGFGVRVQPSGRKLYVVRYRTKDAERRQRKMVLCRVNDAPPEKARAMARDVFQAVACGEDPVGARAKAKPSSVTLEAMFQGYVASMREKGRVSANETERVLLKAKRNAADEIGRNKAPAEVQAIDVVNFVASFYRDGNRGAADKARVYIAAAFNWALHSANDYTTLVRRDWGLDKNPAMSVARDQGAVKVRDRNLDGAEIKLLWDSMEDGTSGFSPAVAGCIRMMIGCGQRVHETLRLHGCEIDLQRAVWHMPAAKTKGKKRDHIIPLPAIVLPYLRTLKDNHGDGPLFPSRSDSKAEVIALVSMSQAVGRWCALNSEAITPFQTRDLRRTWKSRAHDAGVDRFTRDLIQQHAKSDTGSKNYDRADYMPQMREAMDKWSTWLEATVA